MIFFYATADGNPFVSGSTAAQTLAALTGRRIGYLWVAHVKIDGQCFPSPIVESGREMPVEGYVWRVRSVSKNAGRFGCIHAMKVRQRWL